MEANLSWPERLCAPHGRYEEGSRIRIRQSLLPYVVAYVGLACALGIWMDEGMFKDVIVAPWYLITPTGVGLFLFRPVSWELRRWMSRLQLLLSSTFVGFVFMTAVYQALERTDMLPNVFSRLYPLLIAVSTTGSTNKVDLCYAA